MILIQKFNKMTLPKLSKINYHLKAKKHSKVKLN